MLNWLFNFGVMDPPVARAVGAMISAAVVCVLFGRKIIKLLGSRGIVEKTDKTPIEDEKLTSRIGAKSGTPTMGGLIIAVGLGAGCFLWGDLSSPRLWLCMICFAALAVLGAVDDVMKICGGKRGMKVRYKLLFQGCVGTAATAYIIRSGDAAWLRWEAILAWMPAAVAVGCFGILAVLVVAIMSNAVNVTDGLDGLAGGLVIAALLPLLMLLSRSGAAEASRNGGLVVFTAALTGSVVGFLWYNWHPAEVFMGDTGSLAVGGAIGLVALMAGLEVALPLIALVMLAEFGSSVLQVLWFRLTGRRILPIAPLHHIWEKRDLPESHIVFRFCAVGFAFAGLAIVFI